MNNSTKKTKHTEANRGNVHLESALFYMQKKMRVRKGNVFMRLGFGSYRIHNVLYNRSKSYERVNNGDRRVDEGKRYLDVLRKLLKEVNLDVSNSQVVGVRTIKKGKNS